MNLFKDEKIDMAKTFDIQKKEFTTYKYKGDIDTLERFRYLNAQLNIIISRIQNLIDFLSNGQRRLNSKTGMQMLAAFEKQINTETTRVIFYSETIKEIYKDIEETRKGILTEEMKNDLIAIAEKIKGLEEEVGISSRLDDKNLMINIIENIESIRKRVKTQEEIIKSAFGITLDLRIGELRKEVTAQFTDTETEEQT